MGVKVIPVSDKYRKNYDRVFNGKRRIPDWGRWNFDVDEYYSRIMDYTLSGRANGDRQRKEWARIFKS